MSLRYDRDMQTAPIITYVEISGARAGARGKVAVSQVVHGSDEAANC